MIMRILHFFVGHNWSEWIEKVFDEGYYDEETWLERTCPCGKIETKEW